MSQSKSKFKPYKTEQVQTLYDEAINYYDRISENARTFLDDIESKLDFAVEEEVGNIMLSDSQYSWLVSISEGDAERNW